MFPASATAAAVFWPARRKSEAACREANIKNRPRAMLGRAPGRTSREQITQYRPVGNWGLQFSSVGGLVYQNAKRLGLGRELPTELFLQDVKN
jgi:ornithine cyclodeaminase/alanine dehydrogenase-like protein (mu-crystallin family)